MKLAYADVLTSIKQTPHGTVKKQHWKTVIDHEGRGKPNMKIAYKLTDAHLDPKGYQKMNVPLAFQVNFHNQILFRMFCLKILFRIH